MDCLTLPHFAILSHKWHDFRGEGGKLLNINVCFDFSCIKLYNTLALPVLLYGSETWTIKARDARRITAPEIKYMRRKAGYIWTGYKTNAQIAKELKITPILNKLLEI